MKKRLALIIALILVFISGLTIISAAGSTPVAVSSWGELQDAINAAGNGDVLDITVNGGFIEAGWTISINKNITLNFVNDTPARIGVWNGIGPGIKRHFYIVENSPAVTIKNVILDGGNIGGGILTAGSANLTLEDVTLANCVSSTSWGSFSGGAGFRHTRPRLLPLYPTRGLQTATDPFNKNPAAGAHRARRHNNWPRG